MNTHGSQWVPYRLVDVVDADDANLSVRNYIEQGDLRRYLGRIDGWSKINRAAEFGCGYGRMTQVLTEFALDVIGFEREQALLDRATDLIPDVTFIQRDSLSYVEHDGDPFDAVISFTFLQHLIEAEAAKVAGEMMRYLSPMGHILICEETDETHVAGDTEDPLGQCTIGRSVATYCQLFAPMKLAFSARRRIEPGYSRQDTGTYLIFSQPA